MKHLSILGLLLMACMKLSAFDFSVKYNPAIQPADIQYFTPAGGNQFVGDCIPFFRDGKFYLYWLLDENHHGSLNGLGGHQWCVSTSTDLIHWEHHPIAIGIDEEWEKSICTGSVVNDGKKFYAFYATRLLQPDGSVNEQLSYAVSKDGLKYKKHKPNPFYTSAPGYSKRNFRDPKVSIDSKGVFHLFISSEQDKGILGDGRGCLVHLSSADLKQWTVNEPVLSGVRAVPECPDYFEWNGWYYLVYAQDGDTYYVKSRSPYGPWEYPETQALLEQWVNVAKTAEFTGNRRIVAGWIPSRNDNKDDGGERFGGSIVLREAWQLPNGDLATKFPSEVVPKTSAAITVPLRSAGNAEVNGNTVSVKAEGKIGAALCKDLPRNYILTFDVVPEGNSKEYGLILRGSDDGNRGCRLVFDPMEQSVSLGKQAKIEAVDGLDKPFSVTVVVKDDIFDVSIANRRCIVNRQPEAQGSALWFFGRLGNTSFKNIQVKPIVK